MNTATITTVFNNLTPGVYEYTALLTQNGAPVTVQNPPVPTSFTIPIAPSEITETVNVSVS